MIDDRTPNRNAPLPHASNYQDEDVARLREAFTIFDADIGALLLAVAAKAGVGHVHVIADVTGLQAALDGKAPLGHLHALNDLSDVDVSGASNGQFLKRIGTIWAPAKVTLGDLDSASFNADAIAPTANRIWLTPTLKAIYDAAAPLASPALTGNPTAPTQAAGNNSTRIANTAFVQAAIAALVNASPAQLDTLQELAAALGNDGNFAATMTAALALKAPLASPALSGNPTAPTRTAGDATLSIATTAFVTGAIADATGLPAAGGVGSYVLARRSGSAGFTIGETIAGSSLSPANVAPTDSGSLAGTWRCMGYVQSGAGSSGATTLWQRIV